MILKINITKKLLIKPGFVKTSMQIIYIIYYVNLSDIVLIVQ